MASVASARSLPAAALATPPAREICSQSGREPREPLCELGKEGSQQAGVKRALPASHHTSCSVHKIRLRVDNAEGLAWRLGVEPLLDSLLEPTTEDCRLEAGEDEDAHMNEAAPQAAPEAEEEDDTCAACWHAAWAPGNEILLCDGPGVDGDGCEKAYHLGCLRPPLNGSCLRASGSAPRAVCVRFSASAPSEPQYCALGG